MSLSTVRVRYSETDQMGVVYHAHYLVWCEIARTDFIRRLGQSYAQLERAGILLTVVEAQVRYAAPARYDDVISIACELERVHSRAVIFTYEIRRVEPEPALLLATARTHLVAIDRAGTVRILPTDLLREFRDAIAR